jgi:hypothetical protein
MRIWNGGLRIRGKAETRTESERVNKLRIEARQKREPEVSVLTNSDCGKAETRTESERVNKFRITYLK